MKFTSQVLIECLVLTVSVTNTQVIFKLSNQQLALRATAEYILPSFRLHFFTSLTRNKACGGTVG